MHVQLKYVEKRLIFILLILQLNVWHFNYLMININDLTNDQY